MNNMKLSEKQQKIVDIMRQGGIMKSSEIYQEMLVGGETVSLVTIKRLLSKMVKLNFLKVRGSSRYTSYELSSLALIFSNIDAKHHCSIEPDKRDGLDHYNFDIFNDFPIDIFDKDELVRLDNATKKYKERVMNLSPAIREKEVERLIIDLSWKSSKIEGNTYTLLDTERLILKNQEAKGHDKKEAIMILNHKDTFNFVRENKAVFKTMTRSNLEKLHSIMVKDLNIELGLRSRLVGITGSKYRPLDNIYQITEAVESLSSAISRMKISYAKAFLVLLGVSYIQPFEDGNKRTARLMTNAILLSNGNSPMSYRSTDEIDYKEATIVFYETNSIVPFKEIFIEQYEFACENYAVE